MNKIPLTAVANQSISFNLDGAYWKIHLYQAKTRVYADIWRGGSVIIQGVRCLSGIPLLPYDYLYLPSFGNFIFDTDADWTLFGDTCNLYYLPLDEFNSFMALYNAS